MVLLAAFEVVFLAVIVGFTYLLWRFIFKVYLKTMRGYVPDLISRFKRKDHIDKGQLAINSIWTVCNMYLVSRLVIAYTDCIATFIKIIMEVI